MSPDFRAVAGRFQFDGHFLDAAPCGNGHINDTYEARFRQSDGHCRRYILQRINHHVFHDPPGLMHNIETVTGHIRDKVLRAGGDPQRETLNLIPTLDNGSLLETTDGEYWRAYSYIEGARTYEAAPAPGYIYSAARAFGHFQRLVSDLPASRLHVTIPKFHDTRARFRTFIDTLQRDALDRAHFATPEIQFAAAHEGQVSVLVDLMAEGRLPQRVTHNDTKLNNVMFDEETGKGVCIIDLDTVMPGLSLFDFGDMVRVAASTAAEDERDLARVSFVPSAFGLCLSGYLDAALGFLTPLEVEYLPFAARLLTFECGLRFLTDYLAGDIYFKTDRPAHNLDRCRTQFKLVADMERASAEIEDFLESCSRLDIGRGT